MEIVLEAQAISTTTADSVAIIVGPDKEYGAEAGGWIHELFDRGEFAGKDGDTALLHRPAGFASKRLFAVGKTDARKAAGIAVRALKKTGCRDMAMAVTPGEVEAAAEGLLLGNWEPDAYQTDAKKKEKGVDRARLLVPAVTPELEAALARGRVLGEAQNLTRSLVNEPSNLLTPARLAEEARRVAAESGLECEVLDRARMQQLGMGALLGVAQGSAEPPYMVILRYRGTSADHLGLIGKGVTFDTGGVSIKPSEGMEKMKYDMAGAATVIGAMKAIAALKPALTVTAVAPLVENMCGGKAQRPGDIVKTLNGKTVEVLNTDAEGRLILADAITYALRHLGCTHLIDAATLTGAVAVALAMVNAGVFSNNEALQARVLASAKAEGEKMWPMPMDAEYREMLKSAFADIPNISGGRYGGAITAAKFLEEFIEDKPWVHLDIAGTAWLDESKAWMAKGPTGIAVRTMVRTVTDWA